MNQDKTWTQIVILNHMWEGSYSVPVLNLCSFDWAALCSVLLNLLRAVSSAGKQPQPPQAGLLFFFSWHFPSCPHSLHQDSQPEWRRKMWMRKKTTVQEYREPIAAVFILLARVSVALLDYEVLNVRLSVVSNPDMRGKSGIKDGQTEIQTHQKEKRCGPTATWSEAAPQPKVSGSD